MTNPNCHNRPPWKDTVTIPDGWHADGRKRFREVPDPMSKGCNVYGDVWSREPLVMTRDALGFDCSGCRWAVE